MQSEIVVRLVGGFASQGRRRALDYVDPRAVAADAVAVSRLFPDFTAELYEGCHHLNTSHQAQPARVAAALGALWARSEADLPT